MTFRFRRAFRYGAAAAGVVGLSTAAIVLPPKESIPTALLPSRVLFEGIGRVGRCAYTGGQIYCDYVFHVTQQDSQETWNEVHRRCAGRLVTLAETNGGLYVKAGQIFANMSHILPYQYCQVMAVLQDAVVKRPFSEVVAVLEKDLGCPLSEVFAYVDPTPLAAASLAQVHRGRLRVEDEEVAIKVQYIDIAQRFNGDMRTISFMFATASYFFPGYDFGQIITKLNDTVANELDFRLEGRNNDRAAADLKAAGFGDRVVCPKIFWDYGGKRVLVSKFVPNAVKISDRAGIRKMGLDVREVATLFYDAIAFQIFKTGFFHGDPHAGNILVRKLPDGAPQVVLLDFGLCAELNAAQRREISDIWTASVTHDTPTVTAIAHRYHCEDYDLFASCFLQHPYEYFANNKGRVTNSKELESMRTTVKERMSELNNIVAALPKEYALVLRSIMATKAINRELGDAANRPMRFLRYSLQTSHEDLPRIQLAMLMAKAWIEEKYSSLMLKFALWRHPELNEVFENAALQLSG
uniref:Ubiquinone biosynthesis protein n=1 Tax=Crithidia acanthocephali TaxID=59798 RepID=T1YSR7_9TRYP|nr:ubiquinone biosynthesis protein [Crithidia acanthocephali]